MRSIACDINFSYHIVFFCVPLMKIKDFLEIF